MYIDIISRDAEAPNTNKIPWGEAITAINNVKAVYDEIGIRGTYLQQQIKQRLTGAILDFDHNKQVCNKKLLAALLPHENRQCRNDWIIKCATFKRHFDNNEINVLCGRYENITRKSYVCVIITRLAKTVPREVIKSWP